MKKQEIFDYIDKAAVRYNTVNYNHSGTKKRITGLEIGESVILVFEKDTVDTCGSIYYCGDPKKLGAKELVKVTKEIRGVYGMEITPVDQIQPGKTYR